VGLRLRRLIDPAHPVKKQENALILRDEGIFMGSNSFCE